MHDATPAQEPPVIDSRAHSVSRARWLFHTLLLGAYPLAVGILSIGRGKAQEAVLGGSVSRLALVVGMELALFGAVFGAAWFASRASVDDLLLRCRPRLRFSLLLGLGYSLALRVVLAVVVGAIIAVLLISQAMTFPEIQDFLVRNRPDIEAIVDPGVLRDNPLYFWLTVTVVSFLLGGLREELWRSAFLAGVVKLAPVGFKLPWVQGFGIVAAAVVFGAGHLTQGFLAVGLTGLLGLGLGVIIVAHRSIWPAVLAHGFFNATSLALLPWVADKLPKVSG